MLGGFLAGMSNSNVQVEGIQEAVLTEEQTAFFESCEGIECKDDVDFAVPRMMMENNENFYNLAMAITADEIQHYVATNEEVVYEGGRLKSIFETIKKAIKKAWEKVKGFFKKVFSTIQGWITTDKKFLEKYEDVVKKFKGEVEVSSYKFTNLFGDPEDLTQATIPALKINELARKDDSFVDDECDKIRGFALKGGAGEYKAEATIKADDFGTELKKYFRNGKAEKSSVKFTSKDATDLIAEIRDCKTSKAAAKKSYDACEKFFKGLIADANKAEAQAEAVAKDGKAKVSDMEDRFGKSDALSVGKEKSYKTENVSKAVGIYTKICNRAITISHQVMQAHVSALNQAHSEAKTVILKIAAKANSGDDKKAKNESGSMLEGFSLI